MHSEESERILQALRTAFVGCKGERYKPLVCFISRAKVRGKGSSGMRSDQKVRARS